MKEGKTDIKLLDSTIIIEYLNEGVHRYIIESNEILFISTLSLFEVKKKLLEKKIPEGIVNDKIRFIKERTISLVVDDDITENAAEISLKHKIPVKDSLIYATAILNNATLYTLDNDFHGLKNVVIFDK